MILIILTNSCGAIYHRPAVIMELERRAQPVAGIPDF
jgi:hypothetical protein